MTLSHFLCVAFTVHFPKFASMANLRAPRSLQKTAGPSQMAYRQHHQDYHLRRSFPYSLNQIQRQPRTLGCSADHVLGPPDEPVALKPVVLEIVHPIQDGIAPKRSLLPHPDRRSSRTLTTTSRPYETVIQPG